MIDLFEKVRNDIPQEYRYVAEKAMEKVNECFVLGFPYESGWRRVPWFDKIYTYSTTAPMINKNISLTMSFKDTLMTLDVYEDGHAELYQSDKVCTINVNLDDENYERHVNYIFNNVCEEFHKKIPVYKPAIGDEVIYNDGFDWVRGIVKDVTAERCEVDFGDFEIYEEIGYFTPAKHWAFPEGSVSK